MCKVLKISDWILPLAEKQVKAFQASAPFGRNTKDNRQHPDNDIYGVLSIKIALEQEGITVSKRMVSRTMSEVGLLHKRRKLREIIKAAVEIREKENLIKRDFSAYMPLKKVVLDINEIQCRDGKLHASTALDCFNGEIVVLAIDSNMRKELCIKTIEQLKEKYGNQLHGMIFRSDRGRQYTSEAFRETLKSYKITQRLSGVGRCYDNARMESF